MTERDTLTAIVREVNEFVRMKDSQIRSYVDDIDRLLTTSATLAVPEPDAEWMEYAIRMLAIWDGTHPEHPECPREMYEARATVLFNALPAAADAPDTAASRIAAQDLDLDYSELAAKMNRESE